jgi:hypothetical protein
MVDADSQPKFLNWYFTNKSMVIISYVGERHRSTVRPIHNTPTHNTPIHNTPIHNTPIHNTPIHNSAESRQLRPEHPQYEAGCHFLNRKA